MPAAAIRFVHEARKPSEVAALRAQCNRGEVWVLIGSTEKLGTGWNVQARLRALHHVDVPWRPADLEEEQREDRIVRQGNQNDVVDIFTYVTEGTYDGTVTLIEKCSGAVEFEAVATEHRWVVHISGGSIGRGDLTPDREAVGVPCQRKREIGQWLWCTLVSTWGTVTLGPI
jgi:hypothetical protein